MNPSAIANAISTGKTALGVEFGSTRIKAVLVGEDNAPIASGSHEWENRFENGVWTYHLDDAWTGLQDAYRSLAAEHEGEWELDPRWRPQTSFPLTVGFLLAAHRGHLRLHELHRRGRRVQAPVLLQTARASLLLPWWTPLAGRGRSPSRKSSPATWWRCSPARRCRWTA